MSWRRCMEMGISSKAQAPVLSVKEELLEFKMGENSLLISVFNECSSNCHVDAIEKNRVTRFQSIIIVNKSCCSFGQQLLLYNALNCQDKFFVALS